MHFAEHKLGRRRIVDRITNRCERAPLCESMRMGLVSNKCSLTLVGGMWSSWTSSCQLDNPALLPAVHMAARIRNPRVFMTVYYVVLTCNNISSGYEELSVSLSSNVRI